MASEAAHRAAAIANRGHAEWLLGTRSDDPDALRWAVTATFYSALHAVSVHLVVQGVVVTSHEDRRLAIAHGANGIPADVYAAYRFLMQRSVGARYELWAFAPAEVRRMLDEKLPITFTFVGL